MEKKEKKHMNIMIVTNSAYLNITYVMLYSLFENHKREEINIYLPYEELKKDELNKLVRFVESFEEKHLYPLYVGDAFKKKVRSRNGINVETYYRILGIQLLPQNLKRILYLDVDMIIQGDIILLYNTRMENAPFVVCEDIYGIINGFHAANKKRLGIPDAYSYFNAGVMLYNLERLRETNAVEQMLERIYQNYERYEYNDQDVMNEMYYNQVIYTGWDEYNCPPIWCYLDKELLMRGEVRFADYNEIRELSIEPEVFMDKYQNVTKEIYDHAKIIHYLGNTKPWSKTRKKSQLYNMYDKSYEKTVNQMRKEFFGDKI